MPGKHKPRLNFSSRRCSMSCGGRGWRVCRGASPGASSTVSIRSPTCWTGRPTRPPSR
ncbi:MAG: DUF4236 domain-containing protein [Sphingobium sp.]